MLDSGGVNAFSHVGGHVYVSPEVFALAQTPAELEFVIAHELAHAQLGHAARAGGAVRPAGRAGLGLIPGLHFLIALGYSAEQEFAADAWAYQALRRAGRSHREAAGFLRRYPATPRTTKYSGATPRGLALATRAQDVDNHYLAHPPARERLKRIEGRNASTKPVSLRSRKREGGPSTLGCVHPSFHFPRVPLLVSAFYLAFPFCQVSDSFFGNGHPNPGEIKRFVEELVPESRLLSRRLWRVQAGGDSSWLTV